MQSNQPRSFRHASFKGGIGVARADITPSVGIYARNWGAARHDVAYLPPAELYDTDAYAAWQTPFERGSLEHVLETTSRAIRDVLPN